MRSGRATGRQERHPVGFLCLKSWGSFFPGDIWCKCSLSSFRVSKEAAGSVSTGVADTLIIARTRSLGREGVSWGRRATGFLRGVGCLASRKGRESVWTKSAGNTSAAAFGRRDSLALILAGQSPQRPASKDTRHAPSMQSECPG